MMTGERCRYYFCMIYATYVVIHMQPMQLPRDTAIIIMQLCDIQCQFLNHRLLTLATAIGK